MATVRSLCNFVLTIFAFGAAETSFFAKPVGCGYCADARARIRRCHAEVFRPGMVSRETG